jgi:2-hydroxychromene-2-carboxylate isomerase
VSAAEIAAAQARVEDPAIKAELRARTDEAIALGVFGAPAWVIRRPQGPLLLWGQDRFDWVTAALAGWDPDAGPPPGGPRPLLELPPAKSGATLDVYFDVASPFSYLGLTQLPALACATGVTPRLHPILLGALFKQIGQVDVPMHAMPAAKQRYVRLEMERWARWWGEPFAFPAKFPQRTVDAQRLCLLACDRGFDAGVKLATQLGRAMWADGKNLEDRDVLRAVVESAGLPSGWVDRTKEPELKERLAESTARAIEARVFGVPTFVVNGDQLFWGQDRLALVAEALAR